MKVENRKPQLDGQPRAELPLVLARLHQLNPEALEESLTAMSGDELGFLIAKLVCPKALEENPEAPTRQAWRLLAAQAMADQMPDSTRKKAMLHAMKTRDIAYAVLEKSDGTLKQWLSESSAESLQQALSALTSDERDQVFSRIPVALQEAFSSSWPTDLPQTEALEGKLRGKRGFFQALKSVLQAKKVYQILLSSEGQLNPEATQEEAREAIQLLVECACAEFTPDDEEDEEETPSGSLQDQLQLSETSAVRESALATGAGKEIEKVLNATPELEAAEILTEFEWLQAECDIARGVLEKMTQENHKRSCNFSLLQKKEQLEEGLANAEQRLRDVEGEVKHAVNFGQDRELYKKKTSGQHWHTFSYAGTYHWASPIDKENVCGAVHVHSLHDFREPPHLPPADPDEPKDEVDDPEEPGEDTPSIHQPTLHLMEAHDKAMFLAWEPSEAPVRIQGWELAVHEKRKGPPFIKQSVVRLPVGVTEYALELVPGAEVQVSVVAVPERGDHIEEDLPLEKSAWISNSVSFQAAEEIDDDVDKPPAPPEPEKPAPLEPPAAPVVGIRRSWVEKDSHGVQIRKATWEWPQVAHGNGARAAAQLTVHMSIRKPSGETELPAPMTLPPAVTSYTLSDLLPKSSVNLYVEASNAAGSAALPPFEFIVPFVPAPKLLPFAHEPPRADDALTWAAPTDESTGSAILVKEYVVQLWSSNDVVAQRIGYPASTTSVPLSSIPGLTGGWEMAVSVAAITQDDGESEPSEKVEVRLPVVGPTQILDVTVEGWDSIRARISRPAVATGVFRRDAFKNCKEGPKIALPTLKEVTLRWRQGDESSASSASAKWLGEKVHQIGGEAAGTSQGSAKDIVVPVHELEPGWAYVVEAIIVDSEDLCPAVSASKAFSIPARPEVKLEMPPSRTNPTFSQGTLQWHVANLARVGLGINRAAPAQVTHHACIACPCDCALR